MICGDFNGLKDKFDSVENMFNLKNIINFPTRNNNILDCVYTNRSELYNEPLKLSPIALSDHCCVFCVTKSTSIKPSYIKKQVRDYSPQNKAKFHQLLTNCDFDLINQSSSTDINLAFETFIQLISSIHDSVFPVKTITFYSNKSPWITNSILLAMKKRDNFYRIGETSKFLSMRNKIKTMIKEAKSKFLFNTNSLNSKTEWKKVKRCMGLKEKVMPINISSDELNEYFSSVYINDHDNYNFELNYGNHVNISLELEEIKKEISKIKKPGGIPSWPLWIYHQYTDIIAPIVLNLFQESLNQGVVPNCLKLSNIKPIPKIKKPINAQDYRPITLQHPLLKILEKIAIKQWLKPLITLNLHKFTDQFAFIPTNFGGCQVALTLIVGKILAEMDKRNSVAALCIDFSKAFDKATTSRIMYSLNCLGAPINSIYWFQNLLQNRRHRVFLDNDNTSNFISPKSGVPQGSLSGPILFALLLHTLTPLSNCIQYIKYADDLTLIYSGSYSNANETLQAEIEHITNWSNLNQMIINPNKTKLIQFGPIKNRWTSNLILGDVIIELVDTIKLLGLHFKFDMKWDNHIDNLCNRAYKLIFMLIRVKEFNNSKSLLCTLYYSFIRSLLTYSFPAFCNLSNTLMNKLLKVEKRASIIIGKVPDTQLNEFCNRLCSNLFKKTLTDDHHPLRSLFLVNRSNHVTRSISCGNNLLIPYGNTQRSRDHFIRFCIN